MQSPKLFSLARDVNSWATLRFLGMPVVYGFESNLLTGIGGRTFSWKLIYVQLFAGDL